MIDGTQCLKVTGNAKLEGLLMIAAGGAELQLTKYRGRGIPLSAAALLAELPTIPFHSKVRVA